MALGGDSSATRALILPIADILSEGSRADNGGLVDLGVLPDVVDRAIANHGANLGALCRPCTVVGVLLDVVLNERVLGPAIDRDKDSAGLSASGTAEIYVSSLGVNLGMISQSHSDVPGGTLRPTLTDDEVAGVGEGDRVTIVGRAKVHVATRLVVLVVVLTAHKASDVGELEVGKILDRVGSRGSKSTSNRRKCDSNMREGNHPDCKSEQVSVVVELSVNAW